LGFAPAFAQNNGSDQAANGATRAAGSSVAQNLPKNVSNIVSNTVPNIVPNAVPNIVPKNVPGSVSDKAPGKVPSDAAKNLAPRNVAKNARVQQVIVRDAGDADEVEIQTSGAAVAPEVQTITGPDRIVVDFPGALPSAELRALKVERGALKGVRAGLFVNKPPITRVVLDLSEPESYQISSSPNAVVVKLGRVKPDSARLDSARLDPAKRTGASPSDESAASAKRDSDTVAQAAKAPAAPAAAAKLQTATLVGNNSARSTNEGSGKAAVAKVVNANFPAVTVVPPRGIAPIPRETALTFPTVQAALPPMPFVTVTLVNGMLHIRSEKATLAQVLFEVQRQTHAEIGIPAGAENEEVIADLGPAPARDVLAELLNGTPYNFIFVGNELALERVILTLRDPNY
jgi:hypothetical protein